MGQQNDRYRDPHTYTHPNTSLVVYVHVIGCEGQPLLKQSIARRDDLHLIVDDFSIRGKRPGLIYK